LSIIKDRIPVLLDRVRSKRPVVHAITNWVTGGDVAGALQALGARPVMAVSPEEVAEITAQADALLLNLGTPTPERIAAMVLAGRRANELDHPVVFDPVGTGASAFREEACRQILSKVKLTVIRGNRAEIGALAGRGGQLRGIDAVSGPEDLHTATRILFGQTSAVVSVSGEQDLLFGGQAFITISSGHPLMPRITGSGCMLAAAIAAFAAVDKDFPTAAVAAVACFKRAGELAGREAAGPGTFKFRLLDILFNLTPKDLERVQISEE